MEVVIHWRESQTRDIFQMGQDIQFFLKDKGYKKNDYSVRHEEGEELDPWALQVHLRLNKIKGEKSIYTNPDIAKFHN